MSATMSFGWTPLAIDVMTGDPVVLTLDSTEAITVHTYDSRGNAVSLFGGSNNDYNVSEVSGSTVTRTLIVADVSEGTYTVGIYVSASKGGSTSVRGTINVKKKSK